MIVSLVDMKILDSPASTILVTNSDGTRYAINVPLCFAAKLKKRRPSCSCDADVETGSAVLDTCRNPGRYRNDAFLLRRVGLRGRDRSETGMSKLSWVASR